MMRKKLRLIGKFKFLLFCISIFIFSIQNTNAQVDYLYDCSENIQVDLYGSSCDSGTASVGIPNPSNVFRSVIEVVYKGCNPGPSITLNTNTGSLPANKVPISGVSSNVHVYRADLNTSISSASTAQLCGNCTSNSGLQSIVVYAFRNVVVPVSSSGTFTAISGFNDVQSFTIPIPTDSGPRDITVRVPISEVTSDGRMIRLTASAGGQSTTQDIFGPGAGQSCCLNIVDLTILNVPGSATSINIDVDTRNSVAQSEYGVNGQSYVIAGIVDATVECVNCNDPIAVDDSFETCEGEVLSGINVGDNDQGDSNLNWFLTSAPNNGNASLSLNGDFTYTPTGNFSGTVHLTYEVCEQGLSCCSEGSISVVVKAKPIADAGSSVSICQGESIFLTASGGGTYEWSNGLGAGSSKSVSPNTTTTYTVTVTNGDGCADTDQVTVIVNKEPIFHLKCQDDPLIQRDVTNSSTLCNGGSSQVAFHSGRLVRNRIHQNLWKLQSTGVFFEYADGTATLNMTIENLDDPNLVFDVIVLFSGRTTSPPSGSPNENSGCIGDVDNSDWSYYTSFTGVLVGQNDLQGGVVYFSRTGPAFQVGTGANIFESDVFSASGWLSFEACQEPDNGPEFQISGGFNEGDINVHLSGPILDDENTCLDICSGESVHLTAHLVYGEQPLAYNWSNGLGSGASQVVQPTSTTTYSVTATDSNGCTSVRTITVNVGNGSHADAGPDQTICLGESATLTASGGGTYQWSNGLGSGSTKTVSPNTTTSYTVTVTNGDGCTDTDQVTVIVDPGPNVSASNNGPLTCGGGDVNITANPGGLQYNWSGPGGFSSNNRNATVSNSGTYTVTVTDPSTGCSDTATTVVDGDNDSPDAEAGPNQEICEGESVTLTASGGGTYSWSNGLGNGATKIVSPGTTTTYTVTVTDPGNGCTDTDQVTVIVNPNPNANAGGNEFICTDAGSSVQLNGSASSGSAPYSYSWSGPGINAGNMNQQNPIVSASGTYTLIVTDAEGCQDSDQVNVNFFPAPNANAGPDRLACADQASSVQLDGSASGGTAPYAYSWSGPGINAGNTNQEDPTVSGNGTYTVIVTDANGCMDSDQVTVSSQSLDLDCDGPMQRCAEEPAQFQVNTPIAGATYQWTFTGSPSVVSGSLTSPTVVVVWPNVPGQYTWTATATDPNTGCEATCTAEINITNAVEALAGPDQEVCVGGSVVLDGSNSTPFANYFWSVVSGDFGSVDIGGTSSMPSVSPNQDTEYELTVSDPVNGCTRVDRVVVTVNVDLNPIANINAPNNTCGDIDFVLDGSSSLPPPDDPTTSLSYAWYEGTNLPSGFISSSPSITTSASSTTEYTLVVFSDSGCSDTTSVEIQVINCMSLGGVVWSDDNNDGQQNNGELSLGFKGKTVTIDLYDATTNTLIASQSTAPNGSYFFTNLPPGDYFVEFMPPASLPVSSSITEMADNQQDGDDNGIQNDSNNDGLTDGVITSPVINLSPGNEPVGEPGAKGSLDDADDSNGDMTIDFGLVPLMSIGSTVFSDDNNNGFQDPGEGTIGDKGKSVTLELYNANTGALVATTSTDIDGSYIFNNLLPGDYFIEFSPPASLPVSSSMTDLLDNQQDGDDNGIQNDTNGDGITDGLIMSPVINLTGGSEPTNEPSSNGGKDDGNDENGDMTVDFGLVPLVDLSLRKIVNGSTTVAPGDLVTFNIILQNTGPSDATGIEVTDVLPNGYSNISAPGASVVGNTITWGNIILGAGQTQILHFTAVVGLPVSGADYLNIAEITAADQMDADSTPNNGADTDNDGDVGSEDPDDTQDPDDEDDGDDAAVIVECNDIRGIVFIDNDRDGCKDNSDQIIPNLPVSLLDCAGHPILDDSGNSVTTITDHYGEYVFQNACLYGDHLIVSFGNPNNGLVPTIKNSNNCSGINSQINPNGNSDCVPNQTDGPDAGFAPSLSVGSTIYVDLNNNGLQDAGEQTLGAFGKSVILELYNANTGALVATTSTDTDGSYTFNNLSSGDYYIEFLPPASLPVSSDLTDLADNQQDGDDNGIQNDSNGDGITDGLITSIVFNLAAGAEPTNESSTHGNKDAGNDANGDMTIDFGLVPVIDLKLIKVVNGPSDVEAGDVVSFDILVTNDGPSDATGVEVTDVFPNGYSSVSAPGASSVAGNTVTWSGISLAVGQSITLSASAVVEVPGDGVSYVNIADVTDADQLDSDSTPGNGADTDGDGDIGSEDPDGSQDPDDEDDGDDAEVNVAPVGDFDLALVKFVTPGQSPVFIKGQTVTYTIEVTNQGTITADNIIIRDYAPACFNLNDFTWSSAGGGNYDKTLVAGVDLPAGGLAPGATASTFISFVIDNSCQVGEQINIAEIQNATDDMGNAVTDIDSSPDSNPNNDAGGNPNTPSDNATNGIGSGNPGDPVASTDEDDHDPASIIIDAPLAVELLSFTGKYIADTDAVQLDWIVENEVNAAFYDIERSAEGSSEFETIGSVDALGTQGERMDYDHLDRDLGRVELYLYRLKMYDANGDFEYSDIISIELNKVDLPTTVDVYPNPAKDLINIDVSSKDNSRIIVEMFDIKGKQFGNYSVEANSATGDEELQLSLLGLPAGTYVVRARVNDEVFVKRLSVVD